MAYNNGFPATYQSPYPQYQTFQYQQTPAPAPQQNSSIIWVSGEAGAKAYLVAPNSTVQLWDSERQTIYLKSADGSGMPSMKVLDYTIRDQTPANVPAAAQATNMPYATKADVEALAGQIDAIRAEMEGMTAKRATAKTKKEDVDDE